MALSTGHLSDLRSFQLRGVSTRVSHAATVRVHTKKYLCAERCGVSLREFGRRSGLSVTFEDIGVREREEIHGAAGDSSISLSVETPHLFLVIASCYVFALLQHFCDTSPAQALASLACHGPIIFRRLHYCPRQRPRNILELEIRPQFVPACRRFLRGATPLPSHQCPVT